MAGVRIATSVRVSFCQHCRDPHIDLLDEDGRLFAVAILPVELGETFVAEYQAALYRAVASRDEPPP